MWRKQIWGWQARPGHDAGSPGYADIEEKSGESTGKVREKYGKSTGKVKCNPQKDYRIC